MWSGSQRQSMRIVDSDIVRRPFAHGDRMTRLSRRQALELVGMPAGLASGSAVLSAAGRSVGPGDNQGGSWPPGLLALVHSG